ncbi:MAG: hypothetical protein ACRD9L_04595, partial [Bryobacteraceae bacterium]
MASVAGGGVSFQLRWILCRFDIYILPRTFSGNLFRKLNFRFANYREDGRREARLNEAAGAADATRGG